MLSVLQNRPFSNHVADPILLDEGFGETDGVSTYRFDLLHWRPCWESSQRNFHPLQGGGEYFSFEVLSLLIYQIDVYRNIYFYSKFSFTVDNTTFTFKEVLNNCIFN